MLNFLKNLFMICLNMLVGFGVMKGIVLFTVSGVGGLVVNALATMFMSLLVAFVLGRFFLDAGIRVGKSALGFFKGN